MNALVVSTTIQWYIVVVQRCYGTFCFAATKLNVPIHENSACEIIHEFIQGCK